jgi:hypothetical protein
MASSVVVSFCLDEQRNGRTAHSHASFLLREALDAIAARERLQQAGAAGPGGSGLARTGSAIEGGTPASAVRSARADPGIVPASGTAASVTTAGPVAGAGAPPPPAIASPPDSVRPAMLTAGSGTPPAAVPEQGRA